MKFIARVAALVGAVAFVATSLVAGPASAAPQKHKTVVVHSHTRITRTGKIVHVHSFVRRAPVKRVVHVHSYTRVTKSGKVIHVHAHTRMAPHGHKPMSKMHM